MKCPLFLVGRTAVLQKGVGDIGDCLKGECEWWDSGNKNCVLMTVTKCLYDIATFLGEIRSKIPYKKEGP